jgi:3-mercaptopyruvate sulfurtransferase SseA
LAGFSSVSVYDASIREWAADPTAPLVTGDSP